MIKRLLAIVSAALLLCSCGASAAPKGTIGIIGAMEDEVTLLKEMASNKKTTVVSGMEFIEGTIGGNNVVIVQCGMGKVNAGICAEVLITKFNATSIINTGCAGSLDNDIDIGDFVVSTDAVQHDYDVSPIGFERGEIPYTGLYAFPADEGLQARAKKAIEQSAPDSKIFSGRICSGDQFIYLDEQRETITSNFGGLCSEMEGAAIAQVCYLNQVPYVIIRAISDKVDGSEEVEFSEFSKMASEQCASITGYMVEHWNDSAD